jgi:hypothetical protein
MAFTYQRGDVMAAVQRWRVRAVMAGTLYSCPQYQVLAQGDSIMVLPPPNQPVVYVPVYDPAVVYVRHDRPVRDMITFSAGNFSVQWLVNDVDWHGHDVRVPVHHDWDRAHPVWEDHRRAPDAVVIDARPANRPPPVVLHEPPPAPVRDRIVVEERPVVGVEVNAGGKSDHRDAPRPGPRSDVVVTAPGGRSPVQAVPSTDTETRTFTHDPEKPVAPVYPTSVVTPDKKVTTPPAVPTTSPAGSTQRPVRGGSSPKP